MPLKTQNNFVYSNNLSRTQVGEQSKNFCMIHIVVAWFISLTIFCHPFINMYICTTKPDIEKKENLAIINYPALTKRPICII